MEKKSKIYENVNMVLSLVWVVLSVISISLAMQVGSDQHWMIAYLTCLVSLQEAKISSFLNPSKVREAMFYVSVMIFVTMVILSWAM